MSTVIATGTAGLIGSESVKPFANRQKLIQSLPNPQHHDGDPRDRAAAENLFKQPGREILEGSHHVCPAP